MLSALDFGEFLTQRLHGAQSVSLQEAGEDTTDLENEHMTPVWRELPVPRGRIR